MAFGSDDADFEEEEDDDDDVALGGSGGGRSFLCLAGVEAYHRMGDGRTRWFRPESAQRPIMVKRSYCTYVLVAICYGL